ncbi:helix-turn-helix domain-containing protein [Arcanobacterium urinimassiliense]|uniref:helix-turn-helix domain-containing protein n=1 Tax=Arcanobacterium urinimassiliense TaxID=1871014 RepID=UPI00093D3116|nr:helix-turn-helix transcriptional regulator [Arcanobacterium urinimassiliense]
MSTYSPAEKILASALAQALRRQRKLIGKTQEQIALEAGIDRNHYQLMESARSDRRSNRPLNPQLFTLLKVAQVLECSLLDLLAEPLHLYAQATEKETPTPPSV